MLFVEGNKVSFQYEKQDTKLLKDLSFFINDKSKVGLIGKNGAGKSTLFKLILGQLSEFQGVIKKYGGVKIGYLPQELKLDEDLKCIDFLWQTNLRLYDVKCRIGYVDMTKDENLHLYSEYDELGGHKFESEIEKIIEKFNFASQLLEQEISILSGGEKTKLVLAQILLSGADLVLFDEPTNHLDLLTLRWLEDYLSKADFPFVIISHDRSFLDKCISEVWEIEDRQLKTFSGNYSFYKNEVEKEYESMLLKYKKQKKKVKQLSVAATKRRIDANRMENFKLSRSVKKNGGICKRDDGSGSEMSDPTKKMRSAKAIEKRMEMMLEKEQADKPLLEKRRSINFSSEHNCCSKTVLKVQSLSKCYSHTLFNNLSFDLNTNSKVAIVGSNGSGKTTLLKIVMGLELADVGERSKVSVVKAILSGSNLLILDEPTNHLEIAAREAIEDALMNFDGTILFVSHDRRFVEKIADSIFDLESQEIFEDFDSYLKNVNKTYAALSNGRGSCF